jgi:hypothetical protein
MARFSENQLAKPKKRATWISPDGSFQETLQENNP